MRFFQAAGLIGILSSVGILSVAMMLRSEHHKDENPIRGILELGLTDPTAAFEPGLGDRLSASLEPQGAPHVSGGCLVTYPATSCQGDGNPRVIPRTLRPRWGAPVIVDWYTYPTVPPALPNYSCWLLVSTKPSTPVSLNAWHADGCWLLVAPQWVLVPTPGTLLTQEDGHIRLNWTPDVAFKGAVWYMQLLVAEPGKNIAGYKLSGLLKLTIGDL